ncbi:MAG: hypothetical protein JW882_11455 [Deltaproteobacteria bacterium]|nr:hypothetical protein [Deltaproteobacteria bacterium]
MEMKSSEPNLKAENNRFAVLDPRGYVPEVELIPLSPRPGDLKGKTVYIINSMPQGTGLEGILERTALVLKEKFPGVEVISRNRGARYMTDDPELREEMIAGGDAFIYAGNPTSSLTSAAFVFASKLEKSGLPGTVIVYDTFLSVATSSCERLGAPIRYSVIHYPSSEISESQTLDGVERIINALISPLKDEERRTGTYISPRPSRVAVTGTLSEIQDYYYNQGRTDGLPVIPPTKEGVAKMLKGTGHSPDSIVTGSMPPEGLEVTVEQVAVNGVMAGCGPEYMPVLLALVEACSQANIGGMMRSVNSFSFMQVINGPIRKELDMNSGTYALGPGNRANASIGRAMSLFITNLGGGRVGTNIMGAQGNVSSYTFCFAENEEKSPWEPLSVEMGFKPDDSTITIFSGGWSHLGNFSDSSPELGDVSKSIALMDYPNGIVILISPQKAAILAEIGMSKEDVKENIWKNATMTMKQFRAGHAFDGLIKSSIKRGILWPKEYLDMPDDEIVPVYPRENVNVIVVGGDMSPVMQAWKMAYPTTVSIDRWR